jgi:hypothetical protein
MRAVRRTVSVLAIYAVALHTILGGGLFAAAGADPFQVICHSEAAPIDNAPATPAKVCDHCTLCNATAAGAPPLNLAAIAQLTPPRLLHVLHPVTDAARSAPFFQPNLARGPPSLV